jgi:hypothetical protein
VASREAARQAQQVTEKKQDRYMYSKEKRKSSEGRKVLKKRDSLKRQ